MLKSNEKGRKEEGSKEEGKLEHDIHTPRDCTEKDRLNNDIERLVSELKSKDLLLESAVKDKVEDDEIIRKLAEETAKLAEELEIEREKLRRETVNRDKKIHSVYNVFAFPPAPSFQSQIQSLPSLTSSPGMFHQLPYFNHFPIDLYTFPSPPQKSVIASPMTNQSSNVIFPWTRPSGPIPRPLLYTTIRQGVKDRTSELKEESITNTEHLFSYALYGLGYTRLNQLIVNLNPVTKFIVDGYNSVDPRVSAFVRAVYSTLSWSKCREDSIRRFLPGGSCEIKDLSAMITILIKFKALTKIIMNVLPDGTAIFS